MATGRITYRNVILSPLITGKCRPYASHRRHFATANVKKKKVILPESSFELFKKLKATTITPEAVTSKTPKKEKKRKPSDRVIRLAEQVLSLSLIEAADLCELCQEALQASPNQKLPSGRSPFPHPGGYFAGPFMDATMPPPFGGVGQPWMAPPGNVQLPRQLSQHNASDSSLPEGGAAETPQDAPEETVAKKNVTKESKTVSVRLEAFTAARKIALVREVKSLLGLGLKEAKDTVEEAPKLLKANVLREEANQWKEKLEAAGATIVIE